jgi:hypothetical protein
MKEFFLGWGIYSEEAIEIFVTAVPDFVGKISAKYG